MRNDVIVNYREMVGKQGTVWYHSTIFSLGENGMGSQTKCDQIDSCCARNVHRDRMKLKRLPFENQKQEYLPLFSFTMGATASSDNNNGKSDLSADLYVIGKPDSPLPAKEAAFDRARARLVTRVSTQQLLQACADIEAQRYAIWPSRPDGDDDQTNHHRLSRSQLADCVRGLVFGAALGDATGLSTEFLTAAQVKEYYYNNTNSENNISKFQPGIERLFPDTHRLMWMAGDWTDDVDQLVLLMQSLLHCLGHYKCSSNNTDKTSSIVDEAWKESLVRDFAQRMLKWKDHGFAELGDENAAGLGQMTRAVLSKKEAFLQSPITVSKEAWERGGRHAASNGAIMRTAITGVALFWDLPACLEITTTLCQTTHFDPRCVASCAFVATCVALMLQGNDGVATKKTDAAHDKACLSIDGILDKALAVAELELIKQSTDVDLDPEPALAGLRKYVELGRRGSLADLQLDSKGSIGYTFKCLSAGIWALCAVNRGEQDGRSGNFTHVIQQLVAEGGDADTNGAVAGALVGCYFGFSKLPAEWIAQMPYSSWLEAHVQKVLFMLQCRDG